MFVTKLKKVGGSQMLAVPPALVLTMGLAPGVEIEVEVDGDRLVIGKRRGKKKLSELLALCSAELPVSVEDAAWTGDAAVGGEII